MSLFQNGHAFGTAIALDPPAGQGVPFVRVDVEGTSGATTPVIGKIDTGAFMTILDFPTASQLGIADPAVNSRRTRTAQAANGQSFQYYVHRVIVTVENPSGPDLLIPLEAGFAREVKRNLFGVDWLDHVCIAVDRRRVHLLRD